MKIPWLLLIGLCCLGGCEPAEPLSTADQSIRPARIFSVAMQKNTTTHEFVGRVEAAQTVDVSFEVAGPLVRLPVLEGQFMAAGELVAALDATEFALSVRQAEVQLKLANQDLVRKRKLITDKGISQSLVDDAQARYDLNQVALELARERLADTRIVAPFDAYVARRYTDNHVNVQVGERIVRLHDLRELHIVSSIPEDLLATATPERVVSMKARFGFIPDQSFLLEYRENSGEANAVAQTYAVTFAMPRPEQWNILPGMTVSVTVELRSLDGTKPGFQGPTAALVADASKQLFVWLFDPATQRVEKRPVTVGPAAGNGISVLSGLQDGDLIVASGASQLQPGMRVRMLGEPVADL